jgi:ABC-type multidrug transport system fused ATPase/permease subunit
MALPPSHIEQAGVGDALSRLGQDTSIIGQSLSENLGEGLKAVLGAAVGIGMMYFISPTLTLIMLVIFPPISASSYFYGRFIRKLSLKTQESMGEMSKLAEERLSAHRTVTASNTQPSEEKLYAGKVNDVYSLQKKETVANGLFQGFNEVAGDVGMIGLLIYGGFMVKSGDVSVGDMTSLLIYVNWIEWSLNSESHHMAPRICLTVSTGRLLYRSDEGCRCFHAYHRSSRSTITHSPVYRSTCPSQSSRYDRTSRCQIRLPFPT